MRILINGTNYHPEKIGIGKYTGEMAEWLATRGYEVRVVTAHPYYPEWSVAPGYSAWRYQREYKTGIDIWRCPLWVPRKLSGLRRILHLASFAISSLPIMLRQVFWKPDVVLVIEPPLMCAPAAMLVANLCGVCAWMHVQDFEVDAAFDLGILPPGRLRAWVLGIESVLMRRFDRVSTISCNMLARLAGKQVEDSRCMLFPNWVDTEVIFPLVGASVMRAELGISPGTIVALYSGNMGEKQGLEVVLEAARKLVGQTLIQFVMCGEGAVRQRLMQKYNDLRNVVWIPLQPLTHLNELLNMADIHLLPQRADISDLVMPSKLSGMLASGRPVVATVHADSQVAEIVQHSGVITAPGDAVALANTIWRLANGPDERRLLGEQARIYALEKLDKQAILGRFEQALIALISERRSGALRH